MLLEFGFKNFFSFKEGAIISLKLDSNCPTHISQSESFTKVLGIKGANASGKTNILRALSFLSSFAANSFKKEVGSDIFVESFFKKQDIPTEMYIEFSSKDLTYRYEIAATDKEVIKEVISRKKIKEVKLIERKKNKITYRTNEFKKLDLIKQRSNVSIISLMHQYGFTEISDVYDFFDHMITNVGYSGLRETPVSMHAACSFLYENPEALNFVESFLKKSDIGLSSLSIHKHKIDNDNDSGIEELMPLFIHESGKDKLIITKATESSGTKTLLRDLGAHWIALQRGSVLAIDEIDINLHPLILPTILDLYLDPKINTKNAQLLFTTHNTEILNYLGRYRTYLVNKENNESYVYRLDEIPGDVIRNDRPISPAYLDGKLGGVPKIE